MGKGFDGIPAGTIRNDMNNTYACECKKRSGVKKELGVLYYNRDKKKFERRKRCKDCGLKILV